MATGFTSPLVHSPTSSQGRGYTYRSRMGMMSSAEFVVLHDDFHFNVATNVPHEWKAAIIDVGATLTESTVAATGATGAVLIASDATSEGVAVYSEKGGFQLTAGKKCFIEVRVQTSIAAETDVQFGLTDLTATTNPEDLWTTTAANLVAFGTLAGAATVKMLADKSNSGSTAETGTLSLSNATWHTLAIFYDGANLHGYVDGQKALTWAQASTTIPTGTALSLFFGARTGATAGNTTSFDYFRVVLER